jgi:hypothetical protein
MLNGAGRELPNPNVLRPLSRVAPLGTNKLQPIAVVPWLATDLLDEARDTLAMALPNHVPRPVEMKWACSIAALATDDEPIDATQIDGTDVLKEWLRRDKADCHLRGLEMRDARDAVFAVLGGHSPPDVRSLRGVTELRVQQVAHSLGTFCENLVCVPVRFQHDLGYANDVLVSYAFVEEVAHRVHEDAAGLLPVRWVVQFLRHEAQVEALLKGVPRHTPETLRERASIAMLAAGANLRATPDRVPR